jgi:hypothetical protein
MAYAYCACSRRIKGRFANPRVAPQPHGHFDITLERVAAVVKFGVAIAPFVFQVAKILIQLPLALISAAKERVTGRRVAAAR